MCAGYFSPMNNCIFFIDLCEEAFLDLINILGHFQVNLQSLTFDKVKFADTLVLVRQQKKSQNT